MGFEAEYIFLFLAGGEVRYNLHDNKDNEKISLNPKTGEVVTSSTLDYEVKSLVSMLALYKKKRIEL